MSDHQSLEDELLGIHDENHVQKRSETQRAPFRWLGNKLQSTPQLMKFLPYRKKWVDHFCGSGIVTVNRKESLLEVMNDRYGGIVAFYRCIRDAKKCSALIQWLEATCFSREEFYYCRDTWENTEDDVERAAKWYYSIRNSVLDKGHVFGRSLNFKPPIQLPQSLELFWPVHYRIKNVQVENLDVFQCITDYDSSDCVHYFDPPYLDTDQGTYKHKWDRAKMEKLLDYIGNCKGFCALSHYDDDQINARKFWTKKESWSVRGGAEMPVGNADNGKENRAHLIDTHVETQECLWIKA